VTGFVIREELARGDDGIALSVRRWNPEMPDARGAVPHIILVHGWGDCSRRHSHVAASFARKGFGVTVFDLRGHGQSEGRCGDLPRYESMLSDLKAVSALVEGHPRIYVGFSFGGQIVVNFLAAHAPADLCGVALVSTWFRLKLVAPWYQLVLAHLARRLFPAHRQKTPITAEQLSRDAAWMEAQEHEALGQTHRYMSARAYFYAVEGGLRALEKGRESGALGGVPLFTAHGSADCITDPEGTLEFFESYRGLEKVNQVYHDWRHELQNELGREKFLDALTGWAESVAGIGG
jgi:alpha-beta hydrolase superfamily lysophospholipase